MLIILDMYFGYCIVASEYIWAIRQPYNGLIQVVGHFKETRKGAWVEAISNIVISIILVKKFGIVGVTIGTLVSMSIRTVEFVYHSNKYILNRDMMESIKKIVVIILETGLIFIISKLLPTVENVSILTLLINGIIVFIESVIITLGINMIIYKEEYKQLLTKLKRILIKA